MPSRAHSSFSSPSTRQSIHEQYYAIRILEVQDLNRSLSGNRLIDALPLRSRTDLISKCELVPTVFGEHVAAKGGRLEHVYFPVTGFLSLVINIDGHKPLELNIIGREGMVGAEMALDTSRAAYASVVQGSGDALRLTGPAFARELESSPELRVLCNRYLYVLIEQMAQSIACNCFHDVSQRLARWILMTHDRTAGNDLQLTHAFLATMLGVRRSAVTIAAGKLQAQRLIRYSRGRVHVIRRSGLEDIACGCYRAGIESYDRELLSGPVG